MSNEVGLLVSGSVSGRNGVSGILGSSGKAGVSGRVKCQSEGVRLCEGVR